jgi:hypothetical protein
MEEMPMVRVKDKITFKKLLSGEWSEGVVKEVRIFVERDDGQYTEVLVSDIQRIERQTKAVIWNIS